MKNRLVLFLGTHDEEIEYLGEGIDPTGERFLLPWQVWQRRVGVATLADLPPIVIVGTEESREHWLGGRIWEDLNRAGHPHSRRHPIAFFHYHEPDLLKDFWQFFEGLKCILGGEALLDGQPAGLTIEKGEPTTFNQLVDKVTIDITHGYRSIPFLSGPILNFLQTAGNSVQHQILYALREGDQATLRDLSIYTQADHLNRALDHFTRHGRADELVAFFQHPSNAHIPACLALAQPIEAFSQDLLFLRLPELLKESGPKLHAALAENFEQLAAAVGPVRKPLGQFRDQVEALVPGGTPVMTISPEGIQAAKVLAQLLWNTQNYSQLYGLLRETAVTRFALRAPSGVVHRQPDHPEFYKRSRTPNPRPAQNPHAWNELRQTQEKGAAFENPDLWERRNQVAHWGLQGEPKMPKDLRDDLGIEFERIFGTAP